MTKFTRFKTRCLLFLTLLISCRAFAQNNAPDCRAYEFGDFVSGKLPDSVYVLREFANWYEVNVAKGFRNVYSILWQDDCNFSLIFRNCSAADETLHTYHVSDTLHYRAVSSTISGITFSVNYKGKIHLQTLTQQPGLDVWQLMTSRAEEINDSSLFTGIEVYFPDSIKRKLLNQWKSPKVSFNHAEVMQVEYVLSLLKKQDITPFYPFGSNIFKEIVSKEILADYNAYLKYVYGALKSYSVLSSPLQANFNGPVNGVPVATASQYQLDADFEKAKGNVVVNIGIIEDSIYKIQKLNVQPDKNTNLPFIDSLTNDFRTQLKAGDYEKIYHNSAALLKKSFQYEGLKTWLQLITDNGNLDNYKLSGQNFGMDEGRGFVSVAYEMEKDGGSATLTLNYVLENGIFKLGGVYFSRK